MKIKVISILVLYSLLHIMTKLQLIEIMATQMWVTKKFANQFVNCLLKNIIKAVRRTWEAKITGFWTFRKSKRNARDGINPQNPKQLIRIPAMNVVTFRVGRIFKKAVK